LSYYRLPAKNPPDNLKV